MTLRLLSSGVDAVTLNKNAWAVNRREPYTRIGVRRLKCIRCGERAEHQWQICSDGNNYRAICLQCDVALNRLVLEWMCHPRASELASSYELKVMRHVHRE